MKCLATLFLLIFIASPAVGALKSETIEYGHGDAVLEGYLVYDDGIKGKRPGVLVVHEWWGINDYIKKRADMLAKLGYVAFAADIYGKGVRPATAKDAGETAGKYRADRKFLRARAMAGLDVLKGHALTDTKRVAATGYCFGGTTVLELARSGAELSGVVSFHGALDTPNPGETKVVKAKVLVLHGGDDPYVPPKDVIAFEDEMRSAGADWEVVAYGGAVHSFTNPASGNDPSKGLAYNVRADKRSWKAMKAFLKEIFGEGK